MKLADENKNGNLSLREFKKLVDLAEDINSKKKKDANNEGWNFAILKFLNALRIE